MVWPLDDVAIPGLSSEPERQTYESDSETETLVLRLSKAALEDLGLECSNMGFRMLFPEPHIQSHGQSPPPGREAA